MDSGEREQEARQHSDEQHIPRQAAAGQQARDQAGPPCQATGTSCSLSTAVSSYKASSL
jgi:hypothetical protein